MMNAKEKLEQAIQEGSTKVPQVLESIQAEFDSRKDLLVKTERIGFRIEDTNLRLVLLKDTSRDLYLTPHSEAQVYGRANIPVTFAERLIHDEPDLLKENLITLTHRYCKNGILLREVQGIVKGYLSPSYKRMDASPIFESFWKSATEQGYQPFRAFNTDYRYHIGFVLPQVFLLSDSDALAFGIGITTSDYGSKALEIEMFLLRIWCKNLAIGYDLLRRVHLGQRFSMGDDNYIQLSNKTNMLDTKTIASAVTDIVKASKEHINSFNSQIEASNMRDISGKEVEAILKSSILIKKEQEKVLHYFDSSLPIEMLPQKRTAWRLSSAMSLVAKEAQKPDRVIDIEKAAFKILN
jgi:hypothetical protein